MFASVVTLRTLFTIIDSGAGTYCGNPLNPTMCLQRKQVGSAVTRPFGSLLAVPELLDSEIAQELRIGLIDGQ